MVRTLFATLAALLALALPAAAEVNLHNGYVVIHNTADLPLSVVIYHAPPFHDLHGSRGAVIQPQVQIAPRSVYIANNCCYAAGSEYGITISYSQGKDWVHYFTPRLCNERGIPHGYAALAVHHVPGGHVDATITRHDAGCP